jgi:hypothetical protein
VRIGSPLAIFVADVESASLEVVEVGSTRDLSIFILQGYPELDIVLFNLAKSKISATVYNCAVWDTE